jgi:hypothetical protein
MREGGCHEPDARSWFEYVNLSLPILVREQLRWGPDHARRFWEIQLVWFGLALAEGINLLAVVLPRWWVRLEGLGVAGAGMGTVRRGMRGR